MLYRYRIETRQTIVLSISSLAILGGCTRKFVISVSRVFLFVEWPWMPSWLVSTLLCILLSTPSTPILPTPLNRHAGQILCYSIYAYSAASIFHQKGASFPVNNMSKNCGKEFSQKTLSHTHIHIHVQFKVLFESHIAGIQNNKVSVQSQKTKGQFYQLVMFCTKYIVF